jgi:hypothetical protein
VLPQLSVCPLPDLLEFGFGEPHMLFHQERVVFHADMGFALGTEEFQ